jgi:hypothetical protein
MLAQLIDELRQVWRRASPAIVSVRALLVAGVRRAWSIVKPPLLVLVQVLAALAVLFEEWGWRPLVAALGYLARFRLWAALELWIAGLPPYGALVAFALPSLVLLPLKFVAVYLLANGMALTAGLVFIGAKMASTALIARIFMLVKPALMQIGWFAASYHWFMTWKEAIFAEVRASWPWRYGRMVKKRIRHEAKQAWARWRPRVDAALAELRPRARALWWRARAAWRVTRSRGLLAEARTFARETWSRVRQRLAP